MMKKKIAKLHYLTQDGIAGETHASLTQKVCSVGVKWVQFRMKTGDIEGIKYQAKLVLDVCKQYGAACIINDYVGLAKDLGADGVHLGKNDMSPFEARKYLGNDIIIGATANSASDLNKLKNAPVDYFGVGPFNETQSKDKPAPLLGNSIPELADSHTELPVIAIGGIKPEDALWLLDKGVWGVAVSSFINQSNNIEKAAAEMLEAIHQKH